MFNSWVNWILQNVTFSDPRALNTTSWLLPCKSITFTKKSKVESWIEFRCVAEALQIILPGGWPLTRTLNRCCSPMSFICFGTRQQSNTRDKIMTICWSNPRSSSLKLCNVVSDTDNTFWLQRASHQIIYQIVLLNSEAILIATCQSPRCLQNHVLPTPRFSLIWNLSTIWSVVYPTCQSQLLTFFLDIHDLSMSHCPGLSSSAHTFGTLQ